MQIDIDDSTIEDVVREAIDCIDLMADIDVESIVTNEISELNLLDGINVGELVMSAIKDSVEDSDDFNNFMKMKSRVDGLGDVYGQILLRLNDIDERLRMQDEEIVSIRDRLYKVEERKPGWKFWV